jgi:hypothetical protein
MDLNQHKSSGEESKLQTQATGQMQNKNIGDGDTLATELGKGRSFLRQGFVVLFTYYSISYFI